MVSNLLFTLSGFAWAMFFLFSVLALLDKVALTFGKGVLIGLFFFTAAFCTLALMGRDTSSRADAKGKE